jgi:uncharacterized protein
MRAADADILILPGLGDSGPDHWQSRWEARLSSARRVVQRDWDAPLRSEWVDTIAREISNCARPVVCVTHSLGGIALVLAAPQIGDKVAGAFMVAPPSEEAVRRLSSIDLDFLPFPRRPLPFPSVLVASADDPYSDIAFSRAFAESLGAQFIDAGAAGHINVESGRGPWPEGSIAFAKFVATL